MIEAHKKQRLLECVENLAQNDCLLAFSGGADSALMLALLSQAAKRFGKRLFAVYIRTALMPSRDEKTARALADQLGAQYEVLTINEWEDEAITRNTPDRCYHCKRKLFTTLRDQAAQLGISQIIDGTNHDDLQSYRPGLRAIRELGILSPLAQCEISKQEVRALLLDLNLEVAKRPSSPCLATRIPYGTTLDVETLRRIEKAELFLTSLGCYNVRVRLHADVARIEVDSSEMALVVHHRKAVLERFKHLGFLYVSLDLEGFRSGSLDAEIIQQ